MLIKLLGVIIFVLLNFHLKLIKIDFSNFLISNDLHSATFVENNAIENRFLPILKCSFLRYIYCGCIRESYWKSQTFIF